MATPSAFSDLAEHTGTLVGIIGYTLLLCSILVGVVWRVMIRVGENLKNDLLSMIDKVDDKVESHLNESATCKEGLSKTYVLKDDVAALKDEMTDELKFIKAQQYELRTAVLPRDYVRAETLRAWEATMKQGFDDLGRRMDSVSNRLDGILDIKTARRTGP